MMKKAIVSLLLMGTIFSAGALRANAEETTVMGWSLKSDNTWSYTDSTGMYKNKWFEQGEKSYYFNEEGKMVTNSLVTVDGKKYYLDGEGQKIKYWYCINGPWHEFDSKTGEMIN